MFVRESVSIGGRPLTFETGRLAKLARSPGKTVSGFMINSGPITLVLVAIAICLVAIKPF